VELAHIPAMNEIDMEFPSTPASSRLRARAAVAARILLGLVLVANAPVGTLVAPPHAGPEGDALMAALWASPFIMILAKLVELTVGVALLSNRFVAIALVILAPVLVNILGFQLTYSPEVLPLGVTMLALGSFLAWERRAAYRALVSR